MEMKKVISIILLSLTVIILVPVMSFAAEGEIALNDAVIAVAEDAAITERYAAERLSYYLSEIVGSDIAVVSENEAQGVVISVGATSYSDYDAKGKKDGSYEIKSDTDLIVIDGAGNKGTINGVYAFLEQYCGCHWYEDEVIVIPENALLTVSAEIEVQYTPFFEYSETDTKSAYDPEFSVANGLTGGIYKNLTASQ